MKNNTIKSQNIQNNKLNTFHTYCKNFYTQIKQEKEEVKQKDKQPQPNKEQNTNITHKE